MPIGYDNGQATSEAEPDGTELCPMSGLLCPLMVRLRLDGESPLLRGLLAVAAFWYFFRFVGVYRQPGSVNEWLHLSQIGLTGGDHWGIYSQTYSLPTFARMIGVTTPEAWRTMVVMLGVVGFCLFIYVAHRLATRVVDFAVVLTLLLFTPFSRAALNGQADYDGITLIATAFFLISKHPAVALLTGVLMGMTNPEQSAITLVCVALVWFVVDRQNLVRVAISLFALIATTSIIRLILDDPDVTGRLPGFFTTNPGTGKTAYEGLTDFSRLSDFAPHLFAGASLVISALILLAWKAWGPTGTTLVVAAAVVIPCMALLSHGDGSRIFALVMAPVALVAATSLLPRTPRKVLMALLTLTIAWQSLYLNRGWGDFEPLWPTMYENLDSRPEPLD